MTTVDTGVVREDGIIYASSPPVDDGAVSRLHAAAFGEPVAVRPWARQLHDHSLGWVSAYDGAELVGFINVVWDGDLHAFLLDTAVRPDRQRAGIGSGLVKAAVSLAHEAGCLYVHVDTDADLLPFYLKAGEMSPVPAATRAFTTLPSTTPGVVRVGDTVSRAPGPWSPTIRALLQHLKAEGIPVPRPLGPDEDGRERFSWLPGRPTWLEHHRWWGREERVEATAGLIRRLHDALDRFDVPADATWKGGWDRPEDGRGPICHHDLAPWNLVAGPDGELSIIDWEGAGPGDRMAELAYAACGLVPMKRDGKCAELGWLRPPDRAARLEAFRRGYGLADDRRDELADAVVASMRSGLAFGEQAFAEGREPFASWWAVDMGAREREDVAAAEEAVAEWRRGWS